MKIPKYVVFEGIDGSGKSTQIDHVCSFLKERNITPIRLYEPTYGEYGKIIRAHFAERQDDIEPKKENELLVLDRKDHMKLKILPLLKFVDENLGFMILQDRGYLSAPAYQAFSEEEMDRLLKYEQSYAPKPDMFIFLDTPIDLVLSRIEEREGAQSIFETRKRLEEIRTNYLYVVKKYTEENIVVVSNDGRPEEATAQILQELGFGIVTG